MSGTRRSRAFGLVLFALSLAAAGCDTQFRASASGFSLIGPTSRVPVVQFLPQTLMPLPTATFGCPLVQPFTAIFDLVVDSRGSMDVFLTEVSFRFIDGSSFGQSPLIFSGGDLTSRFGQTLILANTTRAFHFTPQFGCGVSRPRTIAAEILLLDRAGTHHRLSLTAPIL
jgi:hypothetical protein